MTDFTVENVGGDRLNVSWNDGEGHFHFHIVALIEDGQMGRVLNKHSGQRVDGTVYKRRQEGGRGSTSYLSATEEPFTSIIAEARAWIGEQRLVPKAIQERKDRIAAAERQRVAAKAKAMREAIGTIVDLLGAQDDQLAKAYDEIQNSCA